MPQITAAYLSGRSEGTDNGQRLPWPNGSLLAARLIAADTPGLAYLVLGGFRLHAQVPPAIPMGHVWLLLINREIPAKLKLLSEAEAIQRIVRMLKHSTQTSNHLKNTKRASHQSSSQPTTRHDPSIQITTGDHTGTARNSGTGFTDTLTSIATTVETATTWRTELHEGEHRYIATVRTDVSGGFHISGRIDLHRIGAMAFSLSGHAHAWHLRVFTEKRFAFLSIRQDFNNWLTQQQRTHPELHGEIYAGLPEDMSVMSGGVHV